MYFVSFCTMMAYYIVHPFLRVTWILKDRKSRPQD
jgi:hypothetical protein